MLDPRLDLGFFANWPLALRGWTEALDFGFVLHEPLLLADLAFPDALTDLETAFDFDFGESDTDLPLGFPFLDADALGLAGLPDERERTFQLSTSSSSS